MRSLIHSPRAAVARLHRRGTAPSRRPAAGRCQRCSCSSGSRLRHHKRQRCRLGSQQWTHQQQAANSSRGERERAAAAAAAAAAHTSSRSPGLLHHPPVAIQIKARYWARAKQSQDMKPRSSSSSRFPAASKLPDGKSGSAWPWMWTTWSQHLSRAHLYALTQFRLRSRSAPARSRIRISIRQDYTR